MTLNSETNNPKAVRSEGVAPCVAGVTNSQNAKGIQRTGDTRVGSCRPADDAEAVQRRNALSHYPIHPSRRAMILHPESGPGPVVVNDAFMAKGC